jgi:hypothetical protein
MLNLLKICFYRNGYRYKSKLYAQQIIILRSSDKYTIRQKQNRTRVNETRQQITVVDKVKKRLEYKPKTISAKTVQAHLPYLRRQVEDNNMICNACCAKEG